jgi:hypothetical protein
MVVDLEIAISTQSICRNRRGTIPEIFGRFVPTNGLLGSWQAVTQAAKLALVLAIPTLEERFSRDRVI